MKRYLAALAALLLLMAGCAHEEPAETTAAATEPPIVEIPLETEADERPYLGVELNFWSALAENDAGARVIVQAAEVFEEKTGAAVNFTWQAGAVSDESEADIFQVPVGTLAGLSCAQDLTEPAAEANYEASSFEVLRQRVVDSCGALTGIPFTPCVQGLYYNPDTFESCGVTEIPDTWEEFLTVCQKLYAAGFRMVLNSEDGADVIRMHLESTLGADQLEQLLSDKQLSGNEQGTQALQQLIDLQAQGYAVHAAAPAGQNKMGAGAGAMLMGSNALCREIEEDTLTELSWGVMPWPAGGAAYADCDVLAVHSSCTETQAAFELILLLTTGEYDQLRAAVTEGIPADPNNTSPIVGAAETLTAARSGRLGSSPEGFRELALQLWDGKYKTGSIFAAAMEKLGKN